MRFSGRLSGVLLVVATLLFGLVGVVPAQAATACAEWPFPANDPAKARICGWVDFADASGASVPGGGVEELHRVNADGTTTRVVSLEMYESRRHPIWFDGVTPGTYLVKILPKGDFVPVTSERFSVRAGDEYALDLTTQVGGRLAGSLQGAGLSDVMLRTSVERKTATGWETLQWQDPERIGHVRTRFDFTGLEPAVPHRVRVEIVPMHVGGYAKFTVSPEFTLQAGQVRSDLVLAIDKGPVVSGRVRPADGTTLPSGLLEYGVQVGLEELVTDASGASRWAFVEARLAKPTADGRYALSAHGAGTFRAVLHTTGSEYWAQPTAPFEVGVNEKRENVDLVVNRSAILTGTLGSVRHFPRVAVVAETLEGGAWVEVAREIQSSEGEFELRVPGALSREVRLRITSLTKKHPDVFWNGTKSGTTSAAGAKLITLRAGRTTSTSTLTLQGDDWPDVRVKSVKVVGSPKVGSVLRASVAGVQPAKARLSYRWLRAGKAIKGATKATYRLVAADQGKRISVRVTATAFKHDGVRVTSRVTAAVRKPVSMKVSTKPGKGTATFRVSLRAKGVRTSSIRGTVVIHQDGRKVRTVAVRGGKARVVLRRQATGAQTFDVTYSGRGALAPAQRTVTVRVR